MESASADPHLSEEILRLEGIGFKSRQDVVLDNINLIIRRGEIHAILGENGCGKSVLGKIISGAAVPNSGRIIVEKPVSVGMVHQERVGSGEFCIWEYLFFDNDKAYKGFFLPRRRMFRDSVRLLENYGISLDVSRKLKELKESEYTAVEIIRQVEKAPEVLVLDEVFIRLGTEYSRIFTGILIRLKRKGTAIVFITHDIEKLYTFAEKVSILKNTEILYSGNVDSIDKVNIIRLAYTETAEKVNLADIETEFYHFLRFNESILNTLPINLVVLDPDRQIIMANRSFEEHFQIDRSSYLYKKVSYIFSDQKNDIYRIIMASFDSTEIQSFFDVPLSLKGKDSINTLKIVPIYDGVSIVGHILIMEDVTDYYSLQKKLMLSDNLSSIGILAAGVGHEINNSLEIVFNYLRYIRNKINEPEVSEPMAELKEELDFISEIVSRLVNFSDVSIKNAEEFDVNNLIASYIQLIRKNDIYTSTGFSFNQSSDPLLIRMNRNEFRQVIINLIKNSCEAVGSSGNVLIETGYNEDSSEKRIIISVSDDGPGIAPDKLDSIFLPFFSTKPSDSKNLGLGLSLCYSIIKKSGGSIRAENSLQGGCRFIIELPVVSANC
ncbi:MAG: ATP-binding cassette domain-containing protein [Spirochaetales bacterium]|nr:ATP-binding cassette domain-containing protein [Spirochaetales bacterium]